MASLAAMRSSTASGLRASRAARPSARAAPLRPTGLPLLRRAAVIRRFKENDTEAEARMRRTEEAIRKPEETIQEAARNAGNAVGNAVGDIKDKVTGKAQADVNRVAETVDYAGAGKGYSAEAVKVPFWMPAFTRRREVFVGRIAMLGFLATCALETFTAQHLGPIRQVQLWSGLSDSSVVAITLAIIAYNVVGGLGPWSPTFSPENLRDLAKRPTGPPTDFPSPPVTQPTDFSFGQWLGISGWGFTKRNELFHGRLAMLGFFFAFINELRTGRGAMGQVAGYLGVAPDNAFYSAALNGFVLFTALDLAKRPAGPPTDFPSAPVTQPTDFSFGQWLGVSSWGFTKRNELFTGRLAMLGFFFAFVNELRFGRGAMGQVAGYLGVAPDNAFYAAALNGFFLFTALGNTAAEDDVCEFGLRDT
ncbi:Photosystem II protein, chloroplastic [Tetrabaena socialis]|uniref:Photosystem II protein, chloroplastic n=1 Tax=Tetrabaena socialis TaxID=47790 RepID=A0A2J8A0C5_9CHLO|nr:Photosystem II protein, chloroplastic [Tetrabaena socialis]|eukprot:PNH05956.1 Photosystem II protein, chloroplastic [Tetrabaena socialis]